ncbi:MAG TPA: CYTH and CHAD domain-containing protein [Methylibium sp.]|uniref:CYTH and CHAD domain-containing protein n=1 Tax=Methylibium sp. TaxID=2067992 RepID=UPI002DBA821C|nr:CYTH and CHAD domain-containing protein [Methylibium sp.]HEU4459845.1 CYTH and CHAD domain-containing protein [Methylibium sp.]
MGEVELKLQVPAAALPALERVLKSAPSKLTRLQATYFDTPERALAQAEVALRLRKEGRRWVQTLKAGAAHGIERAEHNVPVALAAGLQPALDAQRHAGTPAGEALAAALKQATPRWIAVYTTDIRRRHRLQRTRLGVVELALDRGEIRGTGPDGIERRWPVCELEVELVSGSPLAVLDVARRLAAKHGLWLDARTKAERGERLAQGRVPVPAARAAAVELRKAMSPHEAWQAVLRQVLAHALPNWSEVAADDGASAPQADHVHQLRVALRRLRSAERLFAAWPGIDEPRWRDGVAALFRQLGEVRDRDVLAGGLQRQIDAALVEAGQAPAVPSEAAPGGIEPAGLHAHGLALIDLLADAHAPLLPAEGGEPAALPQRMAERLDAWHAQIRRAARRFDRLDDADRHRLRKRLKRLRYAIEFGESLFAAKAVERYLKPMRVAQERLGEFNDVCVAQAAYQQRAAAGEAQAWFALGWLAQRRGQVLRDAGKALRALRKAEPFWPR